MKDIIRVEVGDVEWQQQKCSWWRLILNKVQYC